MPGLSDKRTAFPAADEVSRLAEPGYLRYPGPGGGPLHLAGNRPRIRKGPRTLEEALGALTAVETRLGLALRDQERLRTDNARLMQSLEAASRRAVAAQRIAHHDGLTGLPNRLYLIRRLQQAIAAAGQRHRQLALLFIDLDGFKAVNDGFGHAVADRLLTAVASRIAASVRYDDLACRYGGDEFVTLLTNLADASIAVDVARKIRAHIGESYTINGNVICIDASIGLAVYPDDGQRYDELLTHADAAMYRDKARAGSLGACLSRASGSLCSSAVGP